VNKTRDSESMVPTFCQSYGWEDMQITSLQSQKSNQVDMLCLNACVVQSVSP